MVVERVSATAVRGGAKEGGYGGEVGRASGTTRRKEFVEKAGGANDEYGFGAEVEVGVVSAGLCVALGAVQG